MAFFPAEKIAYFLFAMAAQAAEGLPSKEMSVLGMVSAKCVLIAPSIGAKGPGVVKRMSRCYRWVLEPGRLDGARLVRVRAVVS